MRTDKRVPSPLVSSLHLRQTWLPRCRSFRSRHQTIGTRQKKCICTYIHTEDSAHLGLGLRQSCRISHACFRNIWGDCLSVPHGSSEVSKPNDLDLAGPCFFASACTLQRPAPGPRSNSRFPLHGPITFFSRVTGPWVLGGLLLISQPPTIPCRTQNEWMGWGRWASTRLGHPERLLSHP